LNKVVFILNKLNPCKAIVLSEIDTVRIRQKEGVSATKNRSKVAKKSLYKQQTTRLYPKCRILIFFRSYNMLLNCDAR